MIRAAEAMGGFGTVLAKGERDAGAVMVVMSIRSGNVQVFERMPSLEGGRIWEEITIENIDRPLIINEYIAKRQAQDSDLWILELDVADAERFAALQQKLA